MVIASDHLQLPPAVFSKNVRSQNQNSVVPLNPQLELFLLERLILLEWHIWQQSHVLRYYAFQDLTFSVNTGPFSPQPLSSSERKVGYNIDNSIACWVAKLCGWPRTDRQYDNFASARSFS